MLAYLVLVILWGAYVRASGSGAGCGEHWPLCNGVVIPRAPAVATLIELSHRITSGLSLLLVAGLVIWAYRKFPKGSVERRGATLSGIFLVLEAALGAGLVLLALVGANDSVHRAAAVALHLCNTFILLGCVTYTVVAPSRLDLRGPRGSLCIAAVAAFFFVGASGAVVALGDTLFPSTSFAEGLRQDFSGSAHFLIRLRVLHPILAVATSLLLLYAGFTLRSRVLVSCVALQVMVGIANMLLAAPMALQMLHLLLADATWIALVVAVLRDRETIPTSDAAAPYAAPLAQPS